MNKISADATINIDVLLSNLPKFKNDAETVNKILSQFGKNTGENMDKSFKTNTEKVEQKAKASKKMIDETIGKPVKIDVDDKSFEEKTEKAKRKLTQFPKEIKTQLVAEAKKQGVENFDKLLKKLPYEKKVELKAKAIAGEAIDYKKLIEEIPSKKNTKFTADVEQAETNTKKLGQEAEKTERKFSSLKDIIIGSVVGNAITGGISAIKHGLEEMTEAGMEYNKEQDTMRTVWKSLTEEAPKDGQVLIDYINQVGSHSMYASETIDEMAQSFYHVHSNVEETQKWTNAFVALGSTLHMTKSQVSESGEMFAKIAASGKANAEDVQVMINRFPMWGEAMQKATGKSMKEIYALSASGKLTSEDFVKTLDLLGEKYKNGTEEAMTSYMGMSSYITNRFSKLSGEVTTSTFDMSKRTKGTIENLLSDDMLEKYANSISEALGSLINKVADGLDYLDKHKDTIMDIGGNLKTIMDILASAVWGEAKEIFLGIADMFGLLDDHAKNAKDPLEQIDDILKNLIDHKEDIKKFGKALVLMFAVKKGYDFIKMINSARKAILELTLVEKVADFLSGGLPVGKGKSNKKLVEAGEEIAEDLLPGSKKSGKVAKVGEEVLADVLPSAGKKVAPIAEEAVESVSKLGGLAKIGKSGSLKILSGVGKLAKVVPYLDVLSSATELFGKGSIGSKLGGFTGSLGGTAGGAAAGAAIGSVVPGIGTGIGGAIGAAVGSISGTDIGKKLGKEIEKGLTEKKINLDKIFEGDMNKKSFFETYKKELEELLKNTDASKDSYDKLSEATDKYFEGKKKNSEHDLKILLKNGDITKEQYDNFLKEDDEKNSTQSKNLKNNFNQMSKENERYNKEVSDINSKWDKKKQEQLEASAKTYGKDSKKYKEQEKQVSGQIEKKRNEELLEARDDHEKNMEDLTKTTNKEVTSDLKISKGKQLDLLEDLKNNSKRISHEKMKELIQNSAKERDAQIKDADKTYKETMSSAKKKRDEVVDAADREYYDNHSITKKQHDDIVKKANDTYDETKQTAKSQRDAIVEQAKDTHKSVVDEATAQAGEHKGTVDEETGDVKTSWDNFKSDIGSIFEGVAHAIGSFIHSLNKNWGKDMMDFKFSAHAKGSSGLSEDEVALVGEEGFELAHHPSLGIFPLGVGGPEIRPLKAGTSILPHHMSKEFLEMSKGLPAHKNGVWGTITGIYDWVKDKAEDALSIVGKGAGKIYDMVTDKLSISDFLDSLGDSAQFKVASGGLSTIKDKIVENVQGLFDKFSEENEGGKAPAGAGSERWRDQVVKAAKKVGFPTDKSHIDRIISQIQTESGGNEKAVQGGYTDINTITGDLAKGLMQTISATFNAYKAPGHGNIFNGYDNIMAGLRYIMARYGTGTGFFANIGMGHGYANGGEINGPELAWIGEDPSYSKEYIINPAKPSADALIMKAIHSREQFRPATASNGSSSSSGFLTSEISESSLQKLIQVLNNRPVKVVSHLDGKKISKSVDEYTGSSLTRKLYTGGNLNGR